MDQAELAECHRLKTSETDMSTADCTHRVYRERKCADTIGTAPVPGLAIFNTTIRYDTRCYFNVRSKADISQFNHPHGTDN